MYRNGYGVTKDYGEAGRWYRKAVEQGNAAAQYNMGVMYENGYGVEMDLTKARYWYQKAADQGFEEAKKALARL
jgi:TPR repeat protein